MIHFDLRFVIPAVLALSLSLGACSVAPSGEALDEDDAPVGETSQALTSGYVSYRAPDGIAVSTGNIYFTSHDASSATLWRTAQASSPGQEIVLYNEFGALFGDVVFANVGGAYYGYFFAKSNSSPVLSIKRVSLTGGPATVLATIGSNIDITNTKHNLATDGVSLFWQDDQAIWRLPIGGGTPVAIDAVSPNTPTAGVYLVNGNVVYASVNAIRYVPTAGSVVAPQFRTIVTAATRVTTLWPLVGETYWGENNGSVRWKSGSATATLKAPGGFIATSISLSGGGARVWTECGSSSCGIHFDTLTGSWTTPISARAFGATMQANANTYWGDDAGVHRQIF